MSAFELTVTVTEFASNIWGSATHDFELVVYDCALETHTIVPTSPDLTIRVGDTVSTTLSSDSWTTETRCHPLTILAEWYDESSSTWVDLDPAALPSWVKSLTQETSTAPFSYTLELLVTDSAQVATYELRNKSVNSLQAATI